MEGVTIIDTISHVVEKPTFSWIVIVALVALSIVAGYEALRDLKSKKVIEGLCMAMVVAVSIFVGLNVTGIFVDHKQTETLYVVQVDDSVSLKDFCEKYEIVEINDDKYTVKLRDGVG